MNHLPPLLNVLDKIIRNAGKKIIRDFNEIERLQSSFKVPSNFISKSLANLNNQIVSELVKIKPDLKIFDIKESSQDDGWIISTVDSSTNFSRGISDFMIMIAHKEKKKIVNLILFNPISDDTYYFSDGKGGFKNDYRLRVSERKKLSESLISLNLEKNLTIDTQKYCYFYNILKNIEIEYRINNSIFFELTMLVSGKVDALILYKTNQNIDDISKLMIKETGGFLNKVLYDNREILIISNKYIGKLVKEMIENKNDICE